MRFYKLLLLILAMTVIAIPAAQAAVYQLSDANSLFGFDSNIGANLWSVNGTNQLYEQGFWWRLGDSYEQRLNDNLFSSALLPAANILQVDYNRHTDFDVRVTYMLTGGSVGQMSSDVAETIRITNKSTRQLGMHFFQYSDFDLGGTSGDDQLRFPNVNAVRQTDGSGLTLSETVVTPAADRHEGSIYPNLVNRLSDQSTTNLTNLPAIGGNSIVGDVVWAYQWDRFLAPGETFIISKDKNLSAVPEPATVLLLGLGLVGAEILRRRRRG